MFFTQQASRSHFFGIKALINKGLSLLANLLANSFLLANVSQQDARTAHKLRPFTQFSDLVKKGRLRMFKTLLEWGLSSNWPTPEFPHAPHDSTPAINTAIPARVGKAPVSGRASARETGEASRVRRRAHRQRMVAAVDRPRVAPRRVTPSPKTTNPRLAGRGLG